MNYLVFSCYQGRATLAAITLMESCARTVAEEYPPQSVRSRDCSAMDRYEFLAILSNYLNSLCHKWDWENLPGVPLAAVESGVAA